MPKIEKNEKNVSRCSCPVCPSYNACAKAGNETLYCSADVVKSNCEYKMEGCVCGVCPIHAENKLTSGYYCIEGAAPENFK